jgi:hypothetical protein
MPLIQLNLESNYDLGAKMFSSEYVSLKPGINELSEKQYNFFMSNSKVQQGFELGLFELIEDGPKVADDGFRTKPGDIVEVEQEEDKGANKSPPLWDFGEPVDGEEEAQEPEPPKPLEAPKRRGRPPKPPKLS